MQGGGYIEKLKNLGDQYVHEVYALTREFPKDELYGATSQLRRAALSVVLNIVEGHTRQSDKDFHRFVEISFGSLKESMYLLHFSAKEKYINEDQIKSPVAVGEELGAMLWGILKNRSH